jgi:hypothetical protein
MQYVLLLHLQKSDKFSEDQKGSRPSFDLLQNMIVKCLFSKSGTANDGNAAVNKASASTMKIWFGNRLNLPR